MSALSHDARTPLNAVVLAAEHLAMHLEGRVGDARPSTTCGPSGTRSATSSTCWATCSTW